MKKILIFMLSLSVFTACNFDRGSIEATKQAEAREHEKFLIEATQTAETRNDTVSMPTPDSVHIEENTGSICFTLLDETLVEGRIFPYGCYSGSCTKSASQFLTVYVDNNLGRLDFEFSFILEDYSLSYDLVCTEECGSGIIFFSIDDLTSEYYEVWVGDTMIGDVELPSESICFEDIIK